MPAQKAKSGNLDLFFLDVWTLFASSPASVKERETRHRNPEEGPDYQMLPSNRSATNRGIVSRGHLKQGCVADTKESVEACVYKSAVNPGSLSAHVFCRSLISS